MDVSSVSGAGYAAGVSGAGSNQRPELLSGVAKLLGMSTSDLRTALRGGSSLADLAASKGVSRDQLLSTVESAMNKTPEASGSSSSAADLANKIIDHKGLPVAGHHHRHHHAAAAQASSDASGLPGPSGASSSDAVSTSASDSPDGSVSMLL